MTPRLFVNAPSGRLQTQNFPAIHENSGSGKTQILCDPWLDGTAFDNGWKHISKTKFNYDDLKKLDAGFSFYNYSTNICIPTLKQVLLFCKRNEIGLNIELKSNLGFEKNNVEAIAKLLSNFNFTNQYYFSSFDWPSVVLMKEFLPNAYYGLLIDGFSKDISLKNTLDICEKYNFSCCGFNKNIINSDIMNEMKRHNLITTIYSEKNLKPSEANALWSMGVKSIFIDDPKEFKIS